VEMVIANLLRNAARAQSIVARTLALVPAEPDWPCHSALRNAIMTDRKLWPKQTIAELKPILEKYL